LGFRVETRGHVIRSLQGNPLAEYAAVLPARESREFTTKFSCLEGLTQDHRTLNVLFTAELYVTNCPGDMLYPVSAKPCSGKFLTPETIRRMSASFRRKDFWDRLGGQALVMIG